MKLKSLVDVYVPEIDEADSHLYDWLMYVTDWGVIRGGLLSPCLDWHIYKVT